MNIIIITGSAGLVGGECVEFFANKFDLAIGIENNMRQTFFGADASTNWNNDRLKKKYNNYHHVNIDIRAFEDLSKIFKKYNTDIKLIIHTAAQPSHDWAAKEPFTDFSVNATGTLNMLELTRMYCPKAVFIFTSTNKVYGDNPNLLPLIEKETRFELILSHQYYKNGINEMMSIDHCKHSLFGASKLAADVLTQEYGRYFGLYTGIFRGGCLTGPNHSGTMLHGFLAYLVKCAITKKLYTIFGYKGKQVRDNIHSYDLANMFWYFYKKPRQGEVYNTGGGRYSNCSILEAIKICEELTGNKMNYNYVEQNRIGDHIWWISDMTKFITHYPEWKWKYSVENIIKEIHNSFISNTYRL